MVASALQINYERRDYEYYKEWTKDPNHKAPLRHRQLAFMFALFKVKNGGHIQCVVSGEYGQGKSSTADVLAKYDTRYTKRLLKMYNRYHDESIKFGLDNVIISPLDPSSKYVYNPKLWNAYVIDDAEFFTSTAEATSALTKRLRKSIARNRKKHPSYYWCFPNIFKIPTILLELMDEWAHKESAATGDIIIPSRVIQIKEKFDKDRIERYAHHPRYFWKMIRYHPSFVTKIRFPKIKESGRFWNDYLAKYDKYAPDVSEEARVKESSKIMFFRKLEILLSKGISTANTTKDREEMIYNIIYTTMERKTKNEAVATQMASSFTQQFIKWQEDKFASELTKDLSDSMMRNTKLDIEMKDEDGDNA